jgi:hypothetical protein
MVKEDGEDVVMLRWRQGIGIEATANGSSGCAWRINWTMDVTYMPDRVHNF